MAKPLQFWSGTIMAPAGMALDRYGRQPRQVRCVVMSKSGAAARRAINGTLGYQSESAYRWADWWGTTGNTSDIEAMKAAGEDVVLVRALNDWDAPMVPLSEIMGKGSHGQ